MNMKKWIKASMLLMVAILFAACANEDIAQDKKKENGTEAPKGSVVFATNDTKISAKRRFIDEDEFAGAKTRTNIKHTPDKGADAYWTSDDFIWVKKQDGTWVKSTGTTLHDGGASAEFTLPGNKTDYANGCEVRYTGIGQAYYHNSPSYSTIGIPDNQSRTAANDFSHAGEWGDCGSGKAYNTGNPDKFNFSLSHKPAYLCFLPRCTNGALAPNIRLKSIKINAEIQYTTTGFFANYSDFDGEDIRNTDGTPFGGNIITVTLPDFPLYTTANQEANATYLVVRPGKYDFSIEYTIKDPTTNVEMAFSQMLTNVTLNKGEINDITVDFSQKYYMWDARQDYWYGHLLADGTPDGNTPQSKTADPERWCNDYYPGPGIRIDATQNELFKTLPNANELCWYVMKGDPHRGTGVYADNGHLVTGSGLWLRKKSAIVNYLINTEHYPATLTWDELKEGYRTSATATPKDARVTLMNPINHNLISGNPAQLDDYFFLPVTGIYIGGMLLDPTTYGGYWSSSGNPQYGPNAYTLEFTTSYVLVGDGTRTRGSMARPFE
ncbi:hypothetical protein HMPREF9944_00140 [Segatella maculosa OT 289]|uniref:Fimbrillin family protein n=2 Tax=Segatella maculosa TaxID=439703 RepID=H1HIZ6_9BACT|nr:hypothetical protein HMPREF9944_00140 [Segatella maculosa OT 289]